MDTRNYDELYSHTLENCDCDEDNKCGCSYPNNVSNYVCGCTPEQDCNCPETGATPRPDKETATRIVKDTACICSPKGCACTVERSETDK